jgi:copper chaperone CopZ
MTTVLLITGMRDNRCRERIAGALESLAGVSDVQVNLLLARAIVVHESPPNPGELVKIVTHAGYAAEIKT